MQISSLCYLQTSSQVMAHEINLDAAVVLEQSEVAPPPGSLLSTTTLPLTFFDVPWVYCPPIQRLFFFEFPHPTHHFLQVALPTLKQSLSITLQHFFPFASNLIVPPPPPHTVVSPYICYLDGDSLQFTVAEYSNADFDHLVSDSPRDVRNWHPLVPKLPSPRTEEDGTRVFPLMAIQVTILPNSGFSICLAFRHVAADGTSLHHFMKYWASVCKKTAEAESTLSLSLSLPFHDRNIVQDPKGLKLIYLQELQRPAESDNMQFAGGDVFANNVRATLVLSRERVEKLKKWITLKLGRTTQFSTFVVTCSLFWVCMIKSEQSESDDCVAKGNDELCYFLFPVDCRHRPEFSLPATYFGNCLASCMVAMKRVEVVGENGIVEVANAIEKEIRNWKSGPVGKAETLMSDFMEIFMSGKSLLSVTGSPRQAVYETDFGWGKPKKYESIHNGSGAISLCDCRNTQGGIEVGLVLEKFRMDSFINILEQQFINIVACE